MKDDKIKIKTTDIKIRKDWGDVSPETKIHKVKTDYQRQNNKSEIQKALDQAELDDADLSFD
jgi:hypothetical protein